ncbi:organic cation transporter protein isoform X2 [Anabrus simplex]|uniref:organic cation transporter protein isoform X2 n=1 Tax=Anabrus simplex TaxID=316456 RepID=UPI0034DD7D6B
MTEENKENKEQPPAYDDGLDAALEQIGGPTWWMWMVFLMASTPGVFNIWALTSYVFLSGELDHWCQIPELKAANWTDAQIRNITTGSITGKNCTAPDYDYAYLATLRYEEAMQNITNHPVSSRTTCTKYDYQDAGTSIVSEWDLVCDRLVMRSTVQMVVALGKFIGALLFGFVADKWGRKCSFVISCAMYIIAGPLGGLIPNYWLFVVTRLFLGMAGSGCYNCAFTLLTEVSNAKRRTMLGILYNMSYPVGMLLLPLIAYFVRDWKTLQLALSFPALLLIICCWFIPESPRWLLSQGRRDDAWAVVRQADKQLALTRTTPMGAVNGDAVTKPPQPEPEDDDRTFMERFMASFQRLASLLTNGELCKRLFICYYLWGVTAMTYYALSLNADNFTADKYIYIAIAGALEAVSYVMPIPILRWVGRRPTSGAMYLVSGISLLSIMAVPRDNSIVIMSIAMVGRLCISAVYSVIVLYTTELFPTVNRNTAVGTSSTMSHLGSIAAPYIVDLLGAIQWSIPSTICAVCSLGAGLLVLLLPETKGKELYDTVEEMERKAQRGDKVSLVNCCSCH